jgi:hypothetical protein
VIALCTAAEDIPASTAIANSKAARVKARPRPDTNVTPPGTQYGATLGKAVKRKPLRYAAFATLGKSLQPLTAHS